MRYRFGGFEDLEVYREARRVRRKLMKLVKSFPAREEYCLTSQMRRAAVSVTANIAEGFGRGSNKEQMHFCRISRGSLFELRDHLSTVRDEDYLTEREYRDLDIELKALVKMLNAYIGALNRNLPKK